MSRPKRTLAERIADADERGSNWLAEANKASEKGNHDRAERLFEKAQYWMDLSNRLRLNGDGGGN